MSILIVDDNAGMRQMIRSIVSALDQEIYEAADGAEAVRRYAELRPSWVLMDVEMKPEDGISATRRIRAADPSARIVIVTQYNDAETRRESTEAGALALVSKESLGQLRAVLTRAGT